MNYIPVSDIEIFALVPALNWEPVSTLIMYVTT